MTLLQTHKYYTDIWIHTSTLQQNRAYLAKTEEKWAIQSLSLGQKQPLN